VTDRVPVSVIFPFPNTLCLFFKCSGHAWTQYWILSPSEAGCTFCILWARLLYTLHILQSSRIPTSPEGVKQNSRGASETSLNGLSCCLVHTINTDKTRQFSVVLSIFETKQFCRVPHFEKGQNCKKTKHVQFSTVLTCLQFGSHCRQDKTKQSCLVLVCSVN